MTEFARLSAPHARPHLKRSLRAATDRQQRRPQGGRDRLGRVDRGDPLPAAGGPGGGTDRRLPARRCGRAGVAARGRGPGRRWWGAMPRDAARRALPPSLRSGAGGEWNPMAGSLCVWQFHTCCPRARTESCREDAGWAMGSEGGQATVELVAAIPALLLAGLLALQLLVAGYALTLADGAAEAGAWRWRRGGRQGARSTRPSRAGLEDNAEISVHGGEVSVRLRPPSPIRAVANASRYQPAWRGRKALDERTVVLVTAVAPRSGSKAAAAASPARLGVDRPGLLIDIGGRPPRPTLVASAGARELEEKLVATCPSCVPPPVGRPVISPSPRARHSRLYARRCRWFATPSRSSTCHRLDCSPRSPIRASASSGSAPRQPRRIAPLSALAVGDLVDRGLAYRGVQAPARLGSARRALFGVLPPDVRAACPPSPGPLGKPNSAEHACYADPDDEETDPARTPQQQRRDHERPGRWRGLHSHPEREAGR